MIKAISEIADALPGLKSQPKLSDINDFSAMLSELNQANPLQDFVQNAQNKIEQGALSVSSKLKAFNMKDDVMNLVYAVNDSTMNSISVQLTGKIGSKVSEGFEQLVKQQ